MIFLMKKTFLSVFNLYMIFFLLVMTILSSGCVNTITNNSPWDQRSEGHKQREKFQEMTALEYLENKGYYEVLGSNGRIFDGPGGCIKCGDLNIGFGGPFYKCTRVNRQGKELPGTEFILADRGDGWQIYRP